jgi:hypothetical protein
LVDLVQYVGQDADQKQIEATLIELGGRVQQSSLPRIPRLVVGCWRGGEEPFSIMQIIAKLKTYILTIVAY